MEKAYLKKLAEVRFAIDELREAEKIIGFTVDIEYRANSFFRVCNELKDAIQYDSYASQFVQKQEMEKLINTNEYLFRCHAIATQQKHTHLDPAKSSRNNQKIGARNRHVEINFSPADKTRFSIEIDDKKYDAVELAENCLKTWEDFLHRHYLPTE